VQCGAVRCSTVWGSAAKQSAGKGGNVGMSKGEEEGGAMGREKWG
jgi:hypothetical protein